MVAEVGSFLVKTKMTIRIFVKCIYIFCEKYIVVAFNCKFSNLIICMICKLPHVWVHFLPKKHCFAKSASQNARNRDKADFTTKVRKLRYESSTLILYKELSSPIFQSGGWEGGSVEHTIKTKVGCFSRNNLGLKGGQEKFYNLSITAIIVWAKSWLRGHIWQLDQKNRRQ